MTDLAALGVSVDSDGIVRASDRLDGFEKSSDRAAGGAGRAERSSGRLSGSLRKLAVVAGGAIAGMASLAGTVRAVTSGLARIDEQAKLAQSLNTTTESIQILSRAADLTGSSFGEVEAGATRLTRRLSLFAADGGGPAAKAIERLGLNAEQLLSVPLNERLQTIARALDENATAAERAGIASQLFGDRGFAAFDRLLQSGVIEGATSDIRDLGVAVSDDVAAQVEEANDALSRLGLVFTAIGNSLTAAVAPALTSFADAVIALRTNSEKLVDVLRTLGVVLTGLAATQIPRVIAGLATMAGGFSATALATGVLTKAIGAARLAMVALGGPLGIVFGLLGSAAAAFVAFSDDAGSAETAAFDAAAANAALMGELDSLADDAGPAAQAAVIALANDNVKLADSAFQAARAELAKKRAFATGAAQNFAPGPVRRSAELQEEQALARLAEAERALEAAIRGRNIASEQIVMTQPVIADGAARAASAVDDLKDAISEAGSAASSIDELTEAQRRASAIIGQMESDSVTLGDVLGALATMYKSGAITAEQFAEATRRAREEMGGTTIMGINLRQSLSSIFADAVTGAKSLKEGVAGLLNQFANLLANRAFMALLGGGLGGGGGLLGLGGFLGFLDSGGTIGAGQSAIVGERRPEIVTGPARVIGGAQTARMMQGGGAQQTQRSEITIKLDVPEGVTVEETRQIAGDVAIQVTQAGLRQNRKSLRGQINTLQDRGTSG